MHGANTGHIILAFASAAARYWLTTFPLVLHELRHWRIRANTIPDPDLRRAALFTHETKGAHCEGAAAFATLAPLRSRKRVVCTLVAYQAMYDYLDTISERSTGDVFHDNRQLHQALVAAVDPAMPPIDYYALHPAHADGGYLSELIETCRAGCAMLPAFAVVAPALRRHASRAAESQALTHAARGDQAHMMQALAAWAATQGDEQGHHLDWWELAGAAGSSLVVHALLASAASASLTADRALAVDRLYHPWAGALQGLLDSLADEHEDLQTGSVALVAQYPSPTSIASRLEAIASQTARRANEARGGLDHAVIIAGMIGQYIAHMERPPPEAADAVLRAFAPVSTPARVILGVRRSVCKGKRP